MNKLFMMVIVVVVSTPAMAATKLYGEMHVSYDKLDVDGIVSKDNLVLNNTIIGIKGVNELRTNLNAIYQLEWQVDSGANNGFNNRNQVIGLAGSFGAFIVGRFDTPLKTVGRKADLFWSSQLGQNRNITNPANWDLRADKIIVYQTPKLSGFQGSVAYAEDIVDSNNSSAISLNGFYKVGRIQLGIAYEKQDLDLVNTKRDAFRLMAAYKKGAVKLVTFYQNEDNSFASTGDPDASVFGIGAAYKVGVGTIKGQYYSRDINGTNNDPDLIALGYDYSLAKKTDVYAQYVKVSKGQTLGGVDHGASIVAPNGGDADGLSIGIRYKF